MYEDLLSCIDRYGLVNNDILNKASSEADRLICEVYSDRFRNYMLIDLFELALAYYEEMNMKPCIVRAARILYYAYREAEDGVYKPARSIYFSEQLKRCYSFRKRAYLADNIRERESAKYLWEKYSIFINTDPLGYLNAGHHD